MIWKLEGICVVWRTDRKIRYQLFVMNIQRPISLTFPRGAMTSILYLEKSSQSLKHRLVRHNIHPSTEDPREHD